MIYHLFNGKHTLCGAVPVPVLPNAVPCFKCRGLASLCGLIW